MAATTSTASYPKRATLLVEGQSPRGVFILCNGKVKLSTSSAGGRTLILTISETGEVLGLPATVTGKSYELTAEIIETAQANFISRENFLPFLREAAEAALPVTRQMAETQHSASEKLARFLLELTADHDRGRGRLNLHWL